MFDRAGLTARRAIIGIVTLGVLVAAVAAYFTLSAEATVPAVNVTSDNVAIRGYDTVAYFTEGKPIKGKSEFEHAWQGARWHFANTTHRDMFAVNPERYAPRYGGYCSMGLAIGEFSDADPEVWTIVDGKLYLNKAKFVQEMWQKDPDAYIVASELNWKKHRKELRINENLR